MYANAGGVERPAAGCGPTATSSAEPCGTWPARPASASSSTSAPASPTPTTSTASPRPRRPTAGRLRRPRSGRAGARPQARASADAAAFIFGDIRDHQDILARAEETLDFAQPIALDARRRPPPLPRRGRPPADWSATTSTPCPRAATWCSRTSAPSEDVGQARRGHEGPQGADFTLVPRSRAEIEPFFAGVELVEPGLVFVDHWRPDGPLPELRDPPSLRRRPQTLTPAQAVPLRGHRNDMAADDLVCQSNAAEAPQPAPPSRQHQQRPRPTDGASADGSTPASMRRAPAIRPATTRTGPPHSLRKNSQAGPGSRRGPRARVTAAGSAGRLEPVVAGDVDVEGVDAHAEDRVVRYRVRCRATGGSSPFAGSTVAWRTPHPSVPVSHRSGSW